MSIATITVLYFAQVAEITQQRQEQWDLTTTTPVSQWLEQLIERYPALAPMQARLKVAINHYHVNHDATISPGDEVAVFEPVTGG